MRKTLFKSMAVFMVLAVLLLGCGVPAVAETADQIVNVLVLGSEDLGNTYFPLIPMVVSLNLTTQTAKVIYFYFETQVTAVAKNSETISVPITLLPNCEPDEIKKGFANTFGIPIDRYLIYKYTYGSYQPIIGVFDMLFPITIDIPEEILGTAQYTTINGNMKAVASANKREYTPISKAGPHELDAVGFIAYHTAIPDRVWSSGDQTTTALEDYKYSDMKHKAAAYALRAVIGRLSPDTAASILRTLVGGQMSDITEEDIALWSVSGVNLDADNPYMSVPGLEGVERQAGDIGSLTGISKYQNQMLTYDSEAIKQQILEFLYGE